MQKEPMLEEILRVLSDGRTLHKQMHLLRVQKYNVGSQEENGQ